MMTTNKFDREMGKKYKLVLLGEAGVGKSTIVVRFVRGRFVEGQASTIGAAFVSQTVCLDDTTVKFEIWDTAGQERYNSLAPMYYRNAHAALVIWDITSRRSFERAQTWIRELRTQAQRNIVLALVGNKNDLEEKREVPQSEVDSFAQQEGIIYMDTSAKTAHNINEVFISVARSLSKQPQENVEPDPGVNRFSVQSIGGQQAAPKTGCCGGAAQ
eukprot:TRINITY_DN1199_c0_g1_i2.p1 TRINITY_DN1199_c0_g1~~TRINITY_DN1199_c0_g1_i2.p1  ORF type:complete len:215 (+),score=40.36 TRINITY_DN1199_c0_g1_i2:1-645(+)